MYHGIYVAPQHDFILFTRNGLSTTFVHRTNFRKNQPITGF